LEAEVDVLVHPALEEAQPMAIIEAMARRIPVIGGKTSGGVPWTLDVGRAGILVDVRSPDQVATAMQRLITDPVLRQDLAERGQALARERFHISAVADAWQTVYAQLAEGK
jgi:glycosyltransferase involved in cell wall biosynthesis